MVGRDSCRFLCVGLIKTMRRMDTCAPLRITESSFDLGRAPKLCNLAVLNYAGMVEAEAMLGRYYYMVIHPHIYRVERLYDIARHFDILTAGRRVSAGVIVHMLITDNSEYLAENVFLLVCRRAIYLAIWSEL